METNQSIPGVGTWLTLASRLKNSKLLMEMEEAVTLLLEKKEKGGPTQGRRT
jgi:hypothetical protein